MIEIPPEDRPTFAHPSPPLLGIAALSFVAILLLFAAATPVQTLNVPFGLMVTSLAIFGAAGIAFPHLFNLRALAFTGLDRLPLKATGIAFLIGATNMLVAGFLMGAARELLPDSWSIFADSTTRLLAGADGPARIAFFVAAAIAAPIGEELFFRGWLQGLVSHRYRPFASALIVAVPFSFLHFDPVGFVARVELGLLFGLARAWTGALAPAIALHAAHNGLQLMIFFLTPDPLRDLDRPFPWGPSTMFAILGLVATVALLRKLKQASDAATIEVLDGTRPAFAMNASAALRTIGVTAVITVTAVAVLVVWGDVLPGADLLNTTAEEKLPSLPDVEPPLPPLPGTE